jgi:hypothetical protein
MRILINLYDLTDAMYHIFGKETVLYRYGIMKEKGGRWSIKTTVMRVDRL